ncbi:MAG: hypothetical protein O7F70_05290 [Gemmatimonadetes bacterium]|nr:hypothetical protein [Gemmatimonadota bacterium]
MTTLYHRTTADAAVAILAYGFRDDLSVSVDPRGLPGVWVSDKPHKPPEDLPDEGTLLAVDFAGGLDELQGTEWAVPEPYRQWLLPAAFVNARCRVRMVEITPRSE